MKHNIVEMLLKTGCALALIAAAPLAGAQNPAPAAPKAPESAATAAPPPAASDQTSYLFGLTFGEQLHRVGITDQISIEAITRGMKDGLGGKKSTPADQQQVQAYVHSVMEAATAHNQTAAKEFLEHNAKEKGVKTTASGLQYKVVAPGDANAAAITATDEVTVQYRGKLLDGSEFDSTYSRGQPATFPVTGVIKGWQEGLVMMKPGAKWTLFVPPDLAYGSTPKPGIPGGSLLVFDVELVSVKPSGTAATPAPATDKKPSPKTAKPAAKSDKPAPKQ
jgi:FKBP-type peptidyl-prolyl cis-trans isomerase